MPPLSTEHVRRCQSGRGAKAPRPGLICLDIGIPSETTAFTSAGLAIGTGYNQAVPNGAAVLFTSKENHPTSGHLPVLKIETI